MGLNAELAHKQKRQAGDTVQELLNISAVLKLARFSETVRPQPNQQRDATGSPFESIPNTPTSPMSPVPPAIPSPSASIKSTRSTRSATSTASNRSGGYESFSFSTIPCKPVPRAACQRCYRVVGYRTNEDGTHVVFDLLDGSTFVCGKGSGPKISHNVVVYDTKEGALSERFPSTQFGAAKSGNGIYARALVAFDCWGQFRRRYGGGSSMLFESCRFVGLITVLDAPATISNQRAKRPVPPYYFGTVEQPVSPRNLMPTQLRKDRTFC